MSHSSNHPGMRRPEKLALAPVQVEAHEQLAALLDSIRIEQHMSPDVPGPRPAMTDAMKERGSAPRGVRVVEDSGFPQPSLSVEEEEAYGTRVRRDRLPPSPVGGGAGGPTNSAHSEHAFGSGAHVRHVRAPNRRLGAVTDRMIGVRLRLASRAPTSIRAIGAHSRREPAGRSRRPNRLICRGWE
jgi:hypothetical protein